MENSVKVTGLCDAKCGKNAKIWYNTTNMASCGDKKCISYLDNIYELWSLEFNERQKFLDELENY